MQTAKFVVVQGIDHKPPFNWWVKHVLKKRDRIIVSVRKQQNRYLEKSHKFGIELHKTVEQANVLNAKNDNNLWTEVISKEMENVKVAFEVLPDGKSVPIGHQFMQCHMFFGIKMKDFRQKARLVTGGYMNKASATIKYASIELRETVRIALMISALNELEMKLSNILNTYVQACDRNGVNHIGS